MLSGLSPCRLPLCFRYTSVVSVSHYQPWVTLTEADGARSVIPVLRSVTLASIFTQVSGLHAEEADGEPEGAVLCGGAVLQGVHRSESEEFGADGGGWLYFQPSQQLLEGETAKYVCQENKLGLFIYSTMNIDCCFCHYQPREND